MPDRKLADQQIPKLQTVQHFSADPLEKEPLFDPIILVKVLTKAGPTSSSNRDSPNQGLYGHRLDLDREMRRKKKTGMQDTRQERGRWTITKQSLSRSGLM